MGTLNPTHSLTRNSLDSGNNARSLFVDHSKAFHAFPFSALTLLVGRQEGHPACKKTGCWFVGGDIWLELCTSYGSSCHHHHPSSWQGLYRNLGEYKEVSRKYLTKADWDIDRSVTSVYISTVYLNNVVRLYVINVCKFLNGGPFHINGQTLKHST